MRIRTLVVCGSGLALLTGVAIAAHGYWTAPPSSIIIWQPMVLFSLPAIVLILLLLLNFKFTGTPYYGLLLAAALALLVLALFAPASILSTALTLPMLALLYWLDDRRIRRAA